MRYHGVRRALLASVTLLLAPVAHAQTATRTGTATPVDQAQSQQGADQAAQPPTADAAASQQTQVDDVVVTGSRIARPEFAAPNPITSFNAANIEQSGNTNLTSFLERVPALAGSLDNTQTSGYDSIARQPFGGAGLNELNLRNLGTNRTLVLVNGRRHVAGEFNTAAVDTNSIPTDLVARVDVLTGGASAVYGADGVSGVVNFILKRDFEGLNARTQFGISEQGDAGNRFASVIAGHNFSDGKANVTLAYEYSAEDQLRYEDRRFLRQDWRRFIVTNNADPADNPRLPDNVLVGDLRYPNESINGAVDVDGDGIPDFDGNGQRYDQGARVGYYATGGSSTPVAGFIGDLLPRIERHSINLLSRYDFSEAFKVSIDGKFVQAKTRTEDQFTGDYPSHIAADNPFIPATIRPFVTADGINVSRDNEDYGRHGEADRRRTYRGVIDVAGRLTDHASYDAYVEYGRTDVRVTKLNDRLADRYLAALDVVTNPATGQPVCRSNLTPASAMGAVTFTPGPTSGCAPLNILGYGSPSQTAIKFFQFDDVSTARVTQLVADASLSGDFGALFELPGGPVQFSVGGEYRRETSRFTPDPYLVRALFYQFDENAVVNPSFGKFDVGEAFGEVNAPILKGVAFAKTLSVGAAGRYSHYSTAGSTGTYQINGVWAPVRDITFRGSYGRSVRAPNIGELFAPAFGTQNYFSDPCDPTAINTGTQYRVANCAAILRGVGANPATFNAQAAATPVVFGSQTGNRNLRPERATTWTAGVVLRPRFLTGFTASIDWFDITLRDAINTPQAGQLAELCVDQPAVNNQFCAAISRAGGTGLINGYTVQPRNVSRFRTAGADLNLDYLIRTSAAGTFDLRLVGGYLNRLEFINTPGAAVENDVDQIGRPRLTAAFTPSWTRGGLTLNYTLRWQDKVRRFARAVTDAQPDYAPASLLRYKALWQHDIQAEYRIPQGFAFYGGVTNLFNQRPDVDATDQPISPLGRFFYAGAKLKLGKQL